MKISVSVNVPGNFWDLQSSWIFKGNLKNISLMTIWIHFTFIAWKECKYGVFSGPYFPAFGPEKTPYLDSFHAVFRLSFVVFTRLTCQIFALILYLFATMASGFSILFQHLYNHTVATATLWKWILALISSCEIRNHPHD